VADLINEARQFTAEELFFSTTDLKGHIQRANKVFQRIAGYSWDELHGKPHNVVRPPDMPRIVFQLLWDYIQSGRPVVAYVKNLAQDGRYYWVVALVGAVPDGYLSVRFKPSSPLFAVVEHLYSELKAVEAAIESESNDRKAAIAASREMLNTKLQTLGFSGYDRFMQQAIKQEMQSREAGLHALAGAVIDAGAANRFDRLVDLLDVLFNDLDLYADINRGVREKSATVTDLSESLRVSALNGAIEADKLGAMAAGLRPVLDWLRSLSEGITREGVKLAASLDELVREVDRVVFALSGAKLQIEMTAQFAHELDGSASLGGMIHGAMRTLRASSSETVRSALRGLDAVKERLATLAESQSRLLESSHSLRPVYLTGRIEMAEGGGARLASVFDDVRQQLDQTGANLTGLQTLLMDLDAHLARGIAQGKRLEESISRIDAA